MADRVGFEPTERSKRFLKCSIVQYRQATTLINIERTLNEQKTGIYELAIVFAIVVKELKGIYLQKGSKNYFASLRSYNKKTGKWERRIVSTRTSDPLIALKTREDLQALEDVAAKNANSSMTRAKAFETVNSLLRWHEVPEIEDDSPSIQTLGSFVDLWLDDMKVTRGNRSHSAYQSHARAFEKAIGPDTIMRAVDQRQVQNWYNSLAKKKLKATTINGYLKSVRRLFKDAENEGVIAKNPATGVKTLEGTTRKKDPFTISDFAEILKEVESLEHPEEWRIVALFGLCLGARINDCSIRRWEEVVLDGKMPHIEYIPEKTKRKSIRVKAPLVEPLLSELRGLKKSKKGFITPALASIPASGKGSLSSTFSELVKDSEIDFRHEKGKGKGIDWFSKSFHSFRHTLPSLMAAANVPEQIRMGIVGHQRLETHLGYTHHDDEQMRAALELSLSSVEGI